MSSLSDEVPIPPKQLMNPNLSSATEKTMLKKFGVPGPLSQDCADHAKIDKNFAKQLVFNEDVGPFKVDGLRLAVESLKQVFAQLESEAKDVYDAVSTKGLGMLCVRHKRKNKNSYSNHSWGTAIDLKFGPKEIPQGTHKTQRGFLTLYPIFNRFGWYWGAEFSGDYVDSMHFEWSEESILKQVVPAPTPLIEHVRGLVDEGMAGHPHLSTVHTLLDAIAAGRPELEAHSAAHAALPEPLAAIAEIAAKSEIAGYEWKDRGQAPIGYTKGMALTFARAYCRLNRGGRYAQIMAQADTGNAARDALTHYRAQFKVAGMDNSQSGADTLRHLFVLLIGLGMRETSGKHCTGRDTEYDKKNAELEKQGKHPKTNKNEEEAEAGLFQLSYNSRKGQGRQPLVDLFADYQKNPTSQFLSVFDEGGVKCTAQDAINWIDGRAGKDGESPGVDFQRYSKIIPEFSVDYAAVALRLVRQQWGPINRHEAEVKRACDAMLKSVQAAVDADKQICPLFA